MDDKAELVFTFEPAINRLSNCISIHSKRTLLTSSVRSCFRVEARFRSIDRLKVSSQKRDIYI